ncbi:MAG: Hsp33 family molecular chaperone HslO [Opitutaceae bacterium]|nr:Hsp33 family molecular chaperone HslO [Opitutaceae bacterium]
MPEEKPNPSAASGATVTVSFVRHRNALLTRGDLGPLFVDYYLHLADHGIRHSPEQDRMFKDALAAFTLHCASRPRHEHIAWTLNFQQPLINFFFAGDNEDCTVVGRIFTENVKEAERNIFYSDIVGRRGGRPRRSVVNFDGAEVLRAVEAYYAHSEQRPVRCFHGGEDEYVMLASHPDCDMAWFRGVEAAGVLTLGQAETVSLIERRAYRWHCGCNQRKILGAIAPAFRTNPDAMFGGEETIHVQCPRCAAQHTLTREALEAYVAQTRKGGA